jgi:hypothetical protein
MVVRAATKWEYEMTQPQLIAARSIHYYSLPIQDQDFSY